MDMKHEDTCTSSAGSPDPAKCYRGNVMIKVRVEESGNITIMHLDGNLFLESLLHVTEMWEGMLAKKPGVIAINCANLRSIDSTAIGTLVKFFNEAMKKNIELIFYDLNPSIRKLFYTIHLEKFFSVMSSKRFQNDYLDRICQHAN